MDQSQFVIERSLDGVNFRVIGSEKAHQSESYTVYDYMDKQPSMGENYYRIKTVHPTMGYSYSAIEMAMIKPTDNARVTIYPNPAYQEITIHFLEAHQEPAILEVANGFGQVVKRITIATTDMQYQLSLQDIPAGMYFIKFQNRSLKRYSQKIILRD